MTLDKSLDADGFLTTSPGSSSFRKAVARLQKSTGIRPIRNEEDETRFLLKGFSRNADLGRAKIIQFTNDIYPLSYFGILAGYKGAIKAVEHPAGFIYLTLFPCNPLAATYHIHAYKKWLLSKRPLIAYTASPVLDFCKYQSADRENLEGVSDVFILDKDEYHLRNGRLYIVGYDRRF